MKMNRQVAVASAAAVIAFVLSASPAFARQGHQGKQPATSTHSSPSRPAPAQSAPRQQAPQPRQPAQAFQVPRQPAPQQSAPQRFDAPRQVAPQQSAPRQAVPRQSAPQQRYDAPRQQAPQQRYSAPQYSAPRYEAPRYAAPRYETPRYSAPRYSSRVYVPTYRPYYSFRPRFSIGLGIFLGYPVAYPSWYSFPYRNYGYSYNPGYISTGPAYSSYGAVSFDITPIEAAVFVDGTYMGVVADFCPTEQPLTLAAGRHRVELTAEGFVPQVFDITVSPGLVLPLQGQLSYR